eukprot:1545342-Alexandrium_andersonii.AAC.1
MRYRSGREIEGEPRRTGVAPPYGRAVPPSNKVAPAPGETMPNKTRAKLAPPFGRSTTFGV